MIVPEGKKDCSWLPLNKHSMNILFKHQPEHGSPRTRARFSENKSAPKLENRKKSPCPPHAPNLLHVLPSRMVGWNELCNPGMSKCLFRLPAWPNDLLHWTQVKFSSLMWVAKWLVKFPAWSNDSSHSEKKCIFSPLFASKCLVISLWVWGGLGTSSTMAFVQLNDLRIFLYSERRNEKYHQVTVIHSMWSFWGWAEQFDCSDSSLFHVYKYSMVGIRRWQNPNCYHYCQNPTMVGFWLVWVCW